jgi:cytochrome P450
MTRFDDIERAFTDWQTFSNASLAYVPVPDQFKDRVPEGFFATGALISQDPPRHTTRRKLINRGFVRGRMAAMEEPIQRIADELIDDFIDDGSCDLMKQYCYGVSLRSIVHLMGMPTDDLPLLKQLVDDQGAVVSDAIKPMSEEERLTRWQRIVNARDYLRSVVEHRREDPGDDLISLMVTSTDEAGEHVLTPDEVVTHMTELLFAGTDTTANLMGAMVQMFDRNPDQLDILKSEPELWPNAIEEGLRLRAPANGIFRITTRDVEVAGVTIPARSVVWLGISSAGWDEGKFETAKEFDVRRSDAGEHVSFGKGRHFCMGAPLTRVEAPIGLRTLYERIPDLRVLSGQSYEYDPVLVAVLLKGLRVEWDR